jgi:hypothetical protein
VVDVRGGEAQRSGVVAGGIPGLVWCLSGSRRCGEFGCVRGLFLRRSTCFCVVTCGLRGLSGFLCCWLGGCVRMYALE